jgi:hypothetical protein
VEKSRRRQDSMHVRLKRASLGVTIVAFGLTVLPPSFTAQAAQAGQVAGPVAVDCDRFEDGQPAVPIVIVTKPAPGVTLPTGSLTIQGAALDCHADVGSGISRVSVFLGRRDNGGLHLGDAVLHEPTPIRVLPADQYASVGWSLNASAPLKAGQLNELYVYARSELTSAETAVVVPIAGEGSNTPTATPTPVPPLAPPEPDASALGAGDAPNDPAGEPPEE